MHANKKILYISPEETFADICQRLEHVNSQHVVLVIPIVAHQLRSFVTWRMLHAYTRRHSITAHIVSKSAYMRSVAHGAHFTVGKTLDTPGQEHFLAAPNYDSFTYMVTDDDVLLPPHPGEPPVRVPRSPQPLNMPLVRRTRPLTPPRLPWDEVDDELLPPPQPLKRRTSSFAQPTMRSRRALRSMRYRRAPGRFATLAPLVFIGLFVLVRSIVRYLRKRGA